MSNLLVHCAVPCDSETFPKYLLELRKIGLNDPIEIFDNDETSSSSQAKKRPHHTSCASKEARYKALVF